MALNLQAELAAVLAEFLEAAVHVTIRARNLYDPEAFERVRIYNTFIKKARHPQLAAYIASTAARLKDLIAAGKLSEVAVVFFSPQRQPLEKVAFNLALALPSAPGEQLDLAALESSLGSVLLKLQFLDTIAARPLPPGSTFEIVAYSRSREGVDRQFFVEDSAAEAELPQPVAAQVLKSIRVGNSLGMQVFFEEQGQQPGSTAA